MGSLREQSKARRRAAIQRAAMSLFAERGYEGATIADVADAAEVSPRTVTLYFSSKIDLALSAATDIASQLGARFSDHPDLGFTDVICDWLDAGATSDPEMVNLINAMFEANPGLRGVANSRLVDDDARPLVRAAIAIETGLAIDDPMVAFALVAASAALSEYLNTLARSALAVDTSLVRTVEQSVFVDYLRAIVAATAHCGTR